MLLQILIQIISWPNLSRSLLCLRQTVLKSTKTYTGKHSRSGSFFGCSFSCRTVLRRSCISNKDDFGLKNKTKNLEKWIVLFSKYNINVAKNKQNKKTYLRKSSKENAAAAWCIIDRLVIQKTTLYCKQGRNQCELNESKQNRTELRSPLLS